ncbi:MAG: ester cyclase [Candidatus Dormibacteraeota bacterium]|nr:ester cyclase [Candidatus Dormibacteraeota bacterium]
MSEEHNAQVFRRWFEEGCSQGNLALIDELYSREYVTHALPPELPPNREGLKLFIGALRSGLPDLQIPVHALVAEGDRVMGRLSLAGTHSGTLLGIPATGRHVDVGLMIIARFDERGLWAEDWSAWDQLGLLQQVGAVPVPAGR